MRWLYTERTVGQPVFSDRKKTENSKVQAPDRKVAGGRLLIKGITRGLFLTSKHPTNKIFKTITRNLEKNLCLSFLHFVQ